MTESRHRIASAHLGNERDAWLAYPKNGSRGHPLQLAVFLDGERYRDGVGAMAIIEDLRARREISDTLFVFVGVSSEDARWLECPCHPPFAAFVLEELLPWVEARFPAAREARERVLIGLSYTGLAASYVALIGQGRFTRVISQSGSYWSQDEWLTGEFAKLSEPLPVGFRLEVGSKETQTNVRHRDDLVQAVAQIDAVARFRDTLLERGHAVAFRLFEGAHGYDGWRQTLPDALRWALPARAQD